MGALKAISNIRGLRDSIIDTISGRAISGKLVKEIDADYAIMRGADRGQRQSATTMQNAIKKVDTDVQGIAGRTSEIISDTNSVLARAAQSGHQTIGKQVGKAIGYGLGAGALSSGISSFQDTFGDQLSGGANFMLSGAKTGIQLGAGLRATTHLGRAAIMANHRFSGKLGNNFHSVLSKRLDGASSDLRNSRTHLNTQNKMHTDKMAQHQRRGQQGVGRHRRLHGHRAKAARQRHGRRYSQDELVDAAENYSYSGDRTRIRRSLSSVRGTNKGRGKKRRRGNQDDLVTEGVKDRLNVVVEKAARNKEFAKKFKSGPGGRTQKHLRAVKGQVDQRLKNIRTVDSKIGEARDLLTKNKDILDNFNAYRRAQNFTGLGAVSGVLKMPATMVGGMLGKGSLFGKHDETAAFVGGSMAKGLYSGAAVGAGVGITSMSTLNLGRNQGPRTRQSGRGFSNISYNATLHSHRMNR